MSTFSDQIREYQFKFLKKMTILCLKMIFINYINFLNIYFFFNYNVPASVIRLEVRRTGKYQFRQGVPDRKVSLLIRLQLGSIKINLRNIKYYQPLIDIDFSLEEPQLIFKIISCVEFLYLSNALANIVTTITSNSNLVPSHFSKYQN